MKRPSFITQFKIEFLLLFTCCRKVFGKMSASNVIPNMKQLYISAGVQEGYVSP